VNEITRLIRVYEKQGDKLIRECALHDISVEDLEKIFGRQQNDPLFYLCYEIDKSHAQLLQPFSGEAFDFDKHAYFLECDATG